MRSNQIACIQKLNDDELIVYDNSTFRLHLFSLKENKILKTLEKGIVCSLHQLSPNLVLAKGNYWISFINKNLNRSIGILAKRWGEQHTKDSLQVYESEESIKIYVIDNNNTPTDPLPVLKS